MATTTTKRQREETDDKTSAQELLRRLGNLEQSVMPKHTKNIQANINDFSITTDSVVVTATVVTDETMKRIVIDWGDGNTDALKARPGVPLAVGLSEPLPQGTYRFSHAYAVSEDRNPFDYFVLLRVEDNTGGVDFRIRKITLTPRYRVTHYRTSVRLLSPCDFITENSNKFSITQLVEGEPVNQWLWEPSNNFFGESQFFRLEGSGVTRELTLADGAIDVSLVLIEEDFIFDDYLSLREQLRATQENELVERTITESGGGCSVLARYHREVTLIVPLPPNTGPTFEFATG